MAAAGSGGMLSNWREKISETLQKAVGPLSDPSQKKVLDLVERATSDLLITPDWAANLEVVDTINNDPTEATDRVLRALRRTFAKPHVQVQLLSLTLLETCVKNSVPHFFEQLSQSELWADMMRVADPSRRWEPEVRDRVLALVEDFGRGLPSPAFRDAYEALVDRGVDFPVRALPDSNAPYYTPPPLPPPGNAGGGGGGGAAGASGAADLSPEDRAAIAAAMAELDAQERARAAHDAALAPPGMPPPGHVPAAMGPAVLMGGAIRPPGYTPPPGYMPPPGYQGLPPPGAYTPPAMLAPGAAPLGATPPGTQQAPPGAAAAADAEQTVAVAANSAELLAEMLAPLVGAAGGPGADPLAVRDGFITDLADQCIRYRSMLHRSVLPRADNEPLLARALAVNEELGRVLAQYEGLLAAAEAAAPTGGGAAPAAAAVAAAVPASSFTLLEEEEEEGKGEGEGGELQTKRAARASALADGGASALPLSSGGAAGGGGGAAADLMSFDTPSEATPSAAAAAAPRAPAEALLAEMDQLVLQREHPLKQHPQTQEGPK